MAGGKRIPDYPLVTSLDGADLLTLWRTSEGKQKRIAATNLVFTPTKTTDANGWTVYDNGVYKKYAISIPFSGTVVGSGTRAPLVYFATPVGKTAAQLRFICNWYGNYAAHCTTGIEVNSTTLIGTSLGNEYSGGALTFTGTVEIEATDR